MKNFILLLPILLLFSCSIQKRKYQNGYYVDWKHKKNSQEQIASKKEPAKTTAPSTGSLTEVHVSSGDKPNLMAEVRHTVVDLMRKKFPLIKSGEDSCDVIIFKDGTEIRSKVQEIGINDIKYKRCDTPNGPMYVSRKSEIFMIKYANGTKEIFKTEPVVTPSPDPSQTNVYKTNKYKREDHPLALPALIAGVLSVIVGYVLGIYAISLGVMSPFLVIPLLLGIIAAVLGMTALNRIREQPDVYKGKGMAIPGFIMGLVIACIYTMIFFFYFLFTL